MNSILGSVVPLAMFLNCKAQTQIGSSSDLYSLTGSTFCEKRCPADLSVFDSAVNGGRAEWKY